VNSIGGFLLGEAGNATPEDLRIIVDVSPGAALWLSQAVEPYMRQRGSGAIVHVPARSGTDPTAGMAAYSLSNAAPSHLVRILDLELRPHGIRVTAVASQLLDTSRNRTVFPAEVLARCPAGSGREHHRLPRQQPRRTPSAVRSCQPTAPGPAASHPAIFPCIRFVLGGNNDVIYEPPLVPRPRRGARRRPRGRFAGRGGPHRPGICRRPARLRADPPSALGPAVNEQGYFVGRVEKNLYWVTDSAYQAAFLTTRDGVVLFDAPPSIGHNLQRAIDQTAAENGVSNKVTHLVYSHHHADHIGGSSLFGKHVVRIGQVQAKQLLASENDPARPVPDVTFETKHTLNVGGERVNLAWHGTNHTPDNSYIHFPDHDTLMLVDIFLPRWVPFDSFNLNEDVPGSIAAPDTAMAYPWKYFIGGHMGRLGTRTDMVLYRQYVNDIINGVKKALATVDPTPYFAKYGNNVWAASQQYLAAVVAYASGPVIKKYLGVLAAADVYTASTTFAILESVRLDLGVGSQVHA